MEFVKDYAKELQKTMKGVSGSWKQKQCLLLSSAFKTYANLWERKNLVIPNHQ
jgi:hypothetical protein